MAGLLWPTMAAAQQPVCGDRTNLAKELAEKYQEFPVGRGVNTRSYMVELFTSESGTWTIMVSQVNGFACLVNAGEGWRRLRPPGPHLGLAL